MLKLECIMFLFDQMLHGRKSFCEYLRKSHSLLCPALRDSHQDSKKHCGSESMEYFQTLFNWQITSCVTVTTQLHAMYRPYQVRSMGLALRLKTSCKLNFVYIIELDKL